MSKQKDSKILLIVDEASTRSRVAEFLSKEAFRISTVPAPCETDRIIEVIHSFVPDLIIFDLIPKPGTDKLEVLKQIFVAMPLSTVIVFANPNQVDVLVSGMELGASGYLFNPVEGLDALALSINSNLKRARILQENRAYRRKLEKINKELETTLEHFKADQRAGRHVQVSMLPEHPQVIANHLFNHRVIPSLYLSGDSVDYKPVSKNKVLFYIADVSGHGSSSAFVTVLLRFRIEQLRREYIRSRFIEKFTPASILAELNKDLLDSGLDKHVTLFVGLLDNEHNRLTYSVAGHHPLPILYTEQQASFIQLDKSSLPIGLMAEASYFEQSITIKEQFSLTLFSDGILEALAMGKMEEKEAFLLKTIEESQGDFEDLKKLLNLNDINQVPDDIAVMSVSKV